MFCYISKETRETDNLSVKGGGLKWDEKRVTWDEGLNQKGFKEIMESYGKS